MMVRLRKEYVRKHEDECTEGIKEERKMATKS
jgi:hypothetical protein